MDLYNNNQEHQQEEASDINNKFRPIFKNCKSNYHSDQVKQSIFNGEEISVDSAYKFNYQIIQAGSNHINNNNVTVTDKEHHQCKSSFWGLKPFHEWEIVKFNFPKGLIFIRNPFTAEGQRYWITKCVYDYIQGEGHGNNIDNLVSKGAKKGCTNVDEFYKKLRWATFGYHHSWDTQSYSEDSSCAFPQEFTDLTNYLSLVLGFEDFKPESGIVKYYDLNSTLTVHQDKSEGNFDAPLWSLSFGQSGIFLIGGATKDLEEPLPMYLHSGDIVIMSGPSRLSYHGVPKIFAPYNDTTNVAPWFIRFDSELQEKNTSDSQEKITFSQLYTSHQSQILVDDNCSKCTFLSNCQFVNPKNKTEIESVLKKWDPFLVKYISNHRINLSVRQVFS